MELYKKMYLHLFNTITDVRSCILRMEYENAYNLLSEAQEETERMYMDAEDEGAEKR